MCVSYLFFIEVLFHCIDRHTEEMRYKVNMKFIYAFYAPYTENLKVI